MKYRKTQLAVSLCLLTVLSVLLGAGLSGQQPGAKDVVYNFDRDTAGQPPAKFQSALTGRGSQGTWVVQADSTAPSKPHVLAQTSADKTDYRFPLAILNEGSYRDLQVSVKFKAISGEADRAAGLIFRVKDANNYYVARANALEDNYRLYHVVDGNRRQFAGANLKVTAGEWHELKVEITGNRITCYYDGSKKIEATDDTFKDAGKVGLWTKADSVTYFDDLTVQEPGSRSAFAPPKTLAQKLVEALAKKHPELVRIGLHVTPPGSAENIIVASNIAAKIGQKSDPEDLQAMKTGRPVVLKEGTNFDVTLPLHDASGKVIGAIGLTLKPSDGEKEAGAKRRALGIAGELEKQIASKDSLFRF